MKRLLVLLLLCLPLGAAAQNANTLTLRFVGVPSGPCAVFMYGINNATSDLYDCNTAGAWIKVGVAGGGGTGTVTSIATTTPITGGTITATGTIACATCVAASSPGVGLAHFAGSTQTVTSSAVDLAADVTGNLPVTNLNSGTSASSSTFWRGDGTWASPSGGAAWSSITNPAGNLALSMGTNTSIFSGTAATAQFFAWKNTTAAIVGTSQGSPLLSLCGRAFHGSADVEDCMTFSELPGNGNDAAITQTIGHTGTSTGVVTVNVPGSFTANAMTASTTVTAHSTGGSPTFNFSSSSTTGMGLDSQPRLAFFDGNTEMLRLGNTAGSEGGAIVNRTYGLGFGDLTSNSSDIAICRSGAGILGIGTTASACNLGGALTGASLAVNDTGNSSASFGSRMTFVANACEASFGITTLATGGTTTDTTNNCLPANSFIDFVVARVTTTITAACTGWSIGDATTAARFASNNTTLTSGTTTDAAHIGTYNNTGIASATTGIWQASAAKVRITCAGGNPGAGAIRVIVYSHSPTAPTS